MQLLFGVKSAKYEDGTSLADVMTWNHYGTETIPPRPVLRIAAENVMSNNEEIKKALNAFFKNILVNPGDAEKLEKEMLRKIGVQVIKEAKRIIEAGNELQENAPGTVRKKGFNKPLYETGLLIKNLGYDYEE
jgi:membrane-associated HD superfamily phosphohydrolase